MTKFLVGLGALLVLLACFRVQPATASADPLMILVIAEDWPVLEREAKSRLAADPLDSAALHALGRLSIDSEMGSGELRQSLLQQAQACIAARPIDAFCQLAYGQILGVMLNGQGGLSALGSVGKVQQAFEMAVAAAPADYDARESLMTFYLRAPGIVGGSMRRARKNADDFARIDPDRAHLLYALIALDGGDPARAEREIAAIAEQAEDEDLNRLAAKRWLDIAQAYLDDGKDDKAMAAFEHALSHGAPSVALAARHALDHLGGQRTAQAGGPVSASR